MTASNPTPFDHLSSRDLWRLRNAREAVADFTTWHLAPADVRATLTPRALVTDQERREWERLLEASRRACAEARAVAGAPLPAGESARRMEHLAHNRAEVARVVYAHRMAAEELARRERLGLRLSALAADLAPAGADPLEIHLGEAEWVHDPRRPSVRIHGPARIHVAHDRRGDVIAEELPSLADDLAAWAYSLPEALTV